MVKYNNRLNKSHSSVLPFASETNPKKDSDRDIIKLNLPFICLQDLRIDLLFDLYVHIISAGSLSIEFIGQSALHHTLEIATFAIEICG